MSRMSIREYDTNAALVNEGDEGDELFIILAGEIAVSVQSEDRSIELVRLQAGNFFGEMSMLQREPRSASCIAVAPTECFVLGADDFLQIVAEYPNMAVNMLEKMLDITAGRLMNTDSLLSQIVEWGDDAKKRAITDQFTGLLNRRYFDENFEPLLAQALRKRMGLSFAMVDIDKFGTLNKTYGAEFCDSILLAVVDAFRASFDDDDLLIRYGGDEFCFIIHGEYELAETQCDAACKRVNSLQFDKYPQLRVSCTIGLVHYNTGIQSSELLNIADKTLYEAKEAGRNRVLIWNKAT